jgi:hypothetical protein
MTQRRLRWGDCSDAPDPRIPQCFSVNLHPLTAPKLDCAPLSCPSVTVASCDPSTLLNCTVSQINSRNFCQRCKSSIACAGEHCALVMVSARSDEAALKRVLSALLGQSPINPADAVVPPFSRLASLKPELTVPRILRPLTHLLTVESFSILSGVRRTRMQISMPRKSGN